MYWADELTKNLDKSKNHRVNDMKTVSGMPHIGSLRALITHDIVYKVMKRNGFNVDFTYVINDMDPMDKIPSYIDKKIYTEHLGKPLFRVPSFNKNYRSYGEYYALKFKDAFNSVGAYPKIIWSHELYESGQMDDVIRKSLDNRNEIRKIYMEIADKNTPDNWYPFQVICPKCGKIGSSFVSGWDGKEVTYECRKDLVSWSVGCGNKGKISPFGGTGKLFWKVDWPAHWVVLSVTVEGAGKDHFTEGGSRDFGVEIIKRVYKREPPLGFMHEWFLLGGKGMSSSKGIGLGADEAVMVLPPEIVRYLIAKTPYQKAINFDPLSSGVIPDLFDKYDECITNSFNDKQEEIKLIFELSQVGNKPKSDFYKIRFRQIVQLVQMPNIDIYELVRDLKGEDLTESEKLDIDRKVKYAKVYLDRYASENERFQYIKKYKDLKVSLNDEDVINLKVINKILKEKTKASGSEIQESLFNITKEQGVRPNKLFSVIYKVLINKDHGPKAGWLIKSIGINVVSSRIDDIVQEYDKR